MWSLGNGRPHGLCDCIESVRVSRTLDTSEFAPKTGSLEKTRLQRDGIKRQSACGGCLGDHRRRRTCKPAKSVGELAKEL